VGPRAWVLQTFIRLRAAGVPAVLVGEPRPGGTLVFHAKHRSLVRRRWWRLRGTVLVAIRADVSEALIADFEIVQNGRYADERRRFQVPLWMQPGILPRDGARGERLERLAYKGFTRNLAPEFTSVAWQQALAARGVEWVADAVPFAGQATAVEALRWSDFREVDAVLAVRPASPSLHRDKPATKLYNAWRAGVPALLGAEHAFRELRRSELDYLEVRDVPEALAAVDRLIGDPGLYRRMVDHGRVRAGEFSDAVLSQRWQQVLCRQIPERLGDPAVRRLRRLPLPLRAALRGLAQAASGERHR
jgi:hypothetical protein